MITPYLQLPGIGSEHGSNMQINCREHWTYIGPVLDLYWTNTRPEPAHVYGKVPCLILESLDKSGEYYGIELTNIKV
jgi:hypothetical protein